MKYTVVIVDDEPAARQGLEMLVKMDGELEVAGTCSNAIEALEKINTEKPDILFVDVQMPEISGIGLLKTLHYMPPAIAFVTAYNEYALNAFDLHATDYLLKPFSDERFLICTEKLKKAAAASKANSLLDPLKNLLNNLPNRAEPVNRSGRLAVKVSGKIIMADLDDIWYIEGEDYYVRIYYRDKELLVRDTLKNLALLLPDDQFLRVHKSTVVNLKKIAEMEAYFNEGLLLKLVNGKTIKVSKSYKTVLQEKLGVG